MVSIRLIDGTEIVLDQLFQYHTYAGLLAGLPDEEMNRRRIEEALRHAKERLLSATAPKLIEPEIEHAPTHVGPPLSPVMRQRRVVPVYYPRLPAITCLGHFIAPGRMTALTVVWFQDRPALPIASPALARIRRIDWKREAQPYDF